MTDQIERIAICHLLLRGTRWMPVSMNRKLGAKDRCAPGGAVISAVLCAVVGGDAVVGWTESSGFMVRKIGADGTLAPLDLHACRSGVGRAALRRQRSRNRSDWYQFVDRRTSYSGTKDR